MWIYGILMDYAAALPGSLIFAVILVLIVLILIITVTVYYLYKIISSQRGRRHTGPEAVINAIGIATNNIDKNASGFITIDSVSWEAINNGEEPIEKYDKVVVTGRIGLKLMVKKIKK